MRIDTADAFARIIAIYAEALAAQGEPLPESFELEVAESPVTACERLNARALDLGALDVEKDQQLADIYESMSAQDARSETDDMVRNRLLRAVAAARATFVVPEPEVVEEPEVVAEEAEPEPAPAAPVDETLSADQAVAILGVSKPEVYKLIKIGKLAATKQGRSWRISAADVLALAQA